ncbi:TadA family conjugal transfer-associated ATPase [Bogoriella caseilytica]|uniref:Pilus assembly protein CpaF n=1 Tax=Bogoriella caseilytica TaxID=56055 RepID=A0A3N2BD91_9MICO|nr:TadA family conjugal transfer-associated ATPase [Bogoriella caseilytica]ROR73202.1 pilus assembly protein CpaF [Bogoriella caseilytica]
MSAPVDDAVARVRRRLAEGADLTSALSSTGDVGAGELLETAERVHAATHGGGPVQALLDDPAVTDVLVNGGNGVWVDRGQGMERTPLTLDAPAARGLATRLAAASGRRLDDASPIVDGTLPGGTRLHAVLPPLGAEGALISLRTHRQTAMTLEDLVAAGTVPRALEPVVRALVSSRANVLISGATGSGKTTLLAALLSLAGHGERLICIEESAELRPDHPHVVHLQVRRANVQQAGEVALAELVRAAMRMRPDRLVLGECRGAEVREVLTALNTGHDGGWATVHANTVREVPARLVALGALAGMSEQTTAAQAVAAVDAVIHLRRGGDGTRRMEQIGVLERTGAELACREAVIHREGQVRSGPAWEVLARRLGLDNRLDP